MLNEEWISRLFILEEEDRVVLADPLGRIVGPGGVVLLARAPGTGAVVGCVALLAYPEAVFELAKMAVTPGAQGRGIGRRLIAAAIDRARALGGARLFLGTYSRLSPAIPSPRRPDSPGSPATVSPWPTTTHARTS
ncbi:GNAT family N-acetyltransferase [Streptomyces krungchingensis]